MPLPLVEQNACASSEFVTLLNTEPKIVVSCLGLCLAEVVKHIEYGICKVRWSANYSAEDVAAGKSS